MIAHPSRLWKTFDMYNVMYTCAIMHNILTDYEGDEDLHVLDAPCSSQFKFKQGFNFSDLQVGSSNFYDSNTYYNMRDDIVNICWKKDGSHYY